MGLSEMAAPLLYWEHMTDCSPMLSYAYHTGAKATYNVIVIVNVNASVIVFVSAKGNIKKSICLRKGKRKGQGKPIGETYSFTTYERSDVSQKIMHRILKQF